MDFMIEFSLALLLVTMAFAMCTLIVETFWPEKYEEIYYGTVKKISNYLNIK